MVVVVVMVVALVLVMIFMLMVAVLVLVIVEVVGVVAAAVVRVVVVMVVVVAVIVVTAVVLIMISDNNYGPRIGQSLFIFCDFHYKKIRVTNRPMDTPFFKVASCKKKSNASGTYVIAHLFTIVRACI